MGRSPRSEARRQAMFETGDPNDAVDPETDPKSETESDIPDIAESAKTAPNARNNLSDRKPVTYHPNVPGTAGPGFSDAIHAMMKRHRELFWPR